MIKVKQCDGNGLSECKRCKSLGLYSLAWDTWFYRVEGMQGRYCISCIDKITGGDYEIEK